MSSAIKTTVPTLPTLQGRWGVGLPWALLSKQQSQHSLHTAGTFRCRAPMSSCCQNNSPNTAYTARTVRCWAPMSSAVKTIVPVQPTQQGRSGVGLPWAVLSKQQFQHCLNSRDCHVWDSQVQCCQNNSSSTAYAAGTVRYGLPWPVLSKQQFQHCLRCRDGQVWPYGAPMSSAVKTTVPVPMPFNRSLKHKNKQMIRHWWNEVKIKLVAISNLSVSIWI